jgi:predicted sugar kinase
MSQIQLRAAAQLSLEVGGGRTPKSSTFKLPALEAATELRRGDTVRITVTDLETGELIVQGGAKVTGVGFKDHEATQTSQAWTERTHALKALGFPVDES